MHKKHIFLRVFQKIALFACVFCAFSAWAETTTCDINYTPVTGNSIQNGTPTPTNPVAIESVGTKVGNKYQISVVAQGKNLFDNANISVIPSSIASNRKGCIIDIDVGTYSIKRFKGISATGHGCYYKLSTDGGTTWGSSITVGVNTARSISVQSNAKIAIYSGTGDSIAEFASYDIMLVEGSTAPTSYAPYSDPITTPIYLNAPLRKVGEYADVLDYKNGTITRNVGVKVLDGTEDWTFSGTAIYAPLAYENIPLSAVCSHFSYNPNATVLSEMGNNEFIFNVSSITRKPNGNLSLKSSLFTSLEVAKAYLASEYAKGTPVIVYYPLATPVVEQIENWSCIPPITDIKIATTKMVDDEFKAAEAKLATTVQTIESVVSRTITQTGQIQVLQDTKQTRPDESCPANMKCLLVQDEDGTPHWYPIIEP